MVDGILRAPAKAGDGEAAGAAEGGAEGSALRIPGVAATNATARRVEARRGGFCNA
jgi:hypothetical protein